MCDMLEYFILYPKFLDCTDILMDGWFQSFLLRQSGTSLKDDDDDDDDDVRAGAKPTVMTFHEDSNGHWYCVYIVILFLQLWFLLHPVMVLSKMTEILEL